MTSFKLLNYFLVGTHPAQLQLYHAYKYAHLFPPQLRIGLTYSANCVISATLVFRDVITQQDVTMVWPVNLCVYL